MNNKITVENIDISNQDVDLADWTIESDQDMLQIYFHDEDYILKHLTDASC
jgi:hypothetical protein